jgi:hypothetical protein
VRTPCTAVSRVTRRGWTRTGTASPVPAAARGVWSGGAAEAEVAGRGLRGVVRPGGDPVAMAVRVVAEVRALTCVIRGQPHRARGVGGTA